MLLPRGLGRDEPGLLLAPESSCPASCCPPPSLWPPTDSDESGEDDKKGRTYLEDAGSIGRPPGIEKVVFPSAHKPLA